MRAPSTRTPTVLFKVRCKDSLREQLRTSAKRNLNSLNGEVVKRLEQSLLDEDIVARLIPALSEHHAARSDDSITRIIREIINRRAIEDRVLITVECERLEGLEGKIKLQWQVSPNGEYYLTDVARTGDCILPWDVIHNERIDSAP